MIRRSAEGPAFVHDTEFISFTLILVCIVSDKNAFAVLKTPQAFLLVLQRFFARIGHWRSEGIKLCRPSHVKIAISEVQEALF